MSKGLKARALTKASKKKLVEGVLNVQSTYNNTKVNLSDLDGNVVIWSSSGSLGFSGAKKSTPFAAAQVGQVVGEKAKMMGVKEVSAVIKGVGQGRESALRAFVAVGINLTSIKDETPVPHNGPRPPKARRV
ncbi:MAG: 30S ribosomal protein S11 [Candidatus Pacebacteria bacterium]|nr:30S ribosomal protein S11 [Candidatus Paceibacterota bacterium]